MILVNQRFMLVEKDRLYEGRDFAVRTVGIGHQDFEKLRMTDNFYIDKTGFIRKGAK